MTLRADSKGQGALVPFRTDADVTSALPLVVQHLASDAVLAYPTETVYGFGTAMRSAAVDRLLAFKPRGVDKAFLLLIANVGMLDPLRVQMSGHAQSLAARFWPGPLTLVLTSDLARAQQLHPALCGAHETIAVRWTSHAGMQRVIAAHGEPITSTSANRPGLPPARSARKIEQGWAGVVSDDSLLVLDGGDCAEPVPSTVVDCSRGGPRVVRSGAISLDALRDVVPDIAGAA